MSPMPVSRRVLTDRLDWAVRMVDTIQRLPLGNKALFFADERNIWTADSCLRRALEALFDLGRHILAKGFGKAPSEYKEVAIQLAQTKVLTEDEAHLMTILAGYRNRLVHFYHEISADELFDVCANHLPDVERIIDGYRRWIQNHPQTIDDSL